MMYYVVDNEFNQEYNKNLIGQYFINPPSYCLVILVNKG